MRIFVAYGYNERDSWIPRLVFPIIEAFGSEVMTGEDLHGEVITEGVKRNIRDSQALIALLTKRDQMDNGLWTTHTWVWQELAEAHALNLPIVEVREQGVDPQGGITGDRQRIEYNENQRDQCLVNLVQVIGRWHRSNSVRLKLLPENFVGEVRPLLNDQRLRCTYSVYMNDNVISTVEARILRITGGLFINAPNIPRQALIQVRVECRDRSWTSDFETIDSFAIHLQQD